MNNTFKRDCRFRKITILTYRDEPNIGNQEDKEGPGIENDAS